MEIQEGKTDNRLLLLDASDNVLVACETLSKDQEVLTEGVMVTLDQVVELGHKVARQDLSEGSTVTKYGASIGRTTAAVKCGQWLHTHNMRSDYIPTYGRDVGDQPMSGQ
jgi:altronate dehydratase small subunit